MARSIVLGFLATLSLLVFAGGGCSSSSTNDQVPATTCTAGETQHCTGPGGCPGGQACSDAGTWGACDCGDAGSGTCPKSGILACRACCDKAYGNQTAAFDEAVRQCACTSDAFCKNECANDCDAGAGTPSQACLSCATGVDTTKCVGGKCTNAGCGVYLACLVSCAA